jgi:hypothetical protein
VNRQRRWGGRLAYGHDLYMWLGGVAWRQQERRPLHVDRGQGPAVEQRQQNQQPDPHNLQSKSNQGRPAATRLETATIDQGVEK